MSNCTPCTPANDELPIFCDPYPATTLAKRLLVEDEAFCQKALTTPPTPQQILRTNANGNIEWATLNTALQFGPVDLGSQSLTTTGAVNAGSMNSAGAISAKTIAVTNTGSGNGISIQTENGTPFSIQSSKTNPAAGGTLNFFGATSDMEFNGASDGIFVFTNTSSQTTKANVFNGANFGINTLTPTEALDVNGSVKSKNGCIVNGANIQYKFLSLRTNNLTRWDIGSDNIAETGANAGSDFFIHNFSDSGTFLSRAMHITRATGYVGFGTFPTHPLQMVSGAHVTVGGTWTNASDKKLKENISYEYPYGLEQILGLKPAKFDFIKGEKNTIGFIAQDVKEQLPEAISSTKNADNEEIMGINSTAIIATLVKAVQQLSSKVDELTQKVQILEANNSPEPTQP